MKKWANILIVALLAASFVFAFGVVNATVSLRYETNSPGDCISTITGANLCEGIEFDKTAAKASFLFTIAVLIYRLYFIKDKGTE